MECTGADQGSRAIEGDLGLGNVDLGGTSRFGSLDSSAMPKPRFDPDFLKPPWQNFKAFTYNINERNLIGQTQFGKVYRGKIPVSLTEALDVTVKIWEYNPRLFDFGLLGGGIFGNLSLAKQHLCMSVGYVDPYVAKVELGMRCVEAEDHEKRPTMKEVVECLEQLQVVKLHGDAVGM
ncbi:hypothetical protein L1049_006543 [Liquidambar formosana]|uniref:Uncharacterized protein n=1 Tax=Liquidambar formosana TaxID=63359 RepID=A0AAP0RG22_LIQFO